MSYKDSYGLVVTTGRDEAVDKNGLVSVTHFGGVYQLEMTIDYDAYGVPSVDEISIRNAKIPAGSAILSADLVVKTAAKTPATTVNIGTVKLDGTVVDADGLVAAQALSQGASVGAGALINTVVAEDQYISVTPSAATDAALGGLKGKLIVTYC